MKIKGPGKILLIILVVAAGLFAFYKYDKAPKVVGDSSTVGKVAIPDAPEASLQGTAAVKLQFPDKSPALNGGLKIVHQIMAWQSQNSWNYANGGKRTTKGSLFDKAGLDLELRRQDDCGQSCTDLVKWASDYAKGGTKDGFFITFMGSGIPAYLYGLTEQLKGLGPEYAPVIFLSTGKSYGEDKVIGDVRFKQNPQNLKGAVARGVRMDGDLDLLLKFAGDNGIKVNANEKLYDPNAVNLSYAKDFLSAVVDYNNNIKETRQIVINGKTTAKDTSVGLDLVATWTPGDVNVKQGGRGGETLISTKIYASVMPNMTITSRKFLNDNREKIKDMIIALAQAGDQIRTFDEAKKYACTVSADVYGEQTGDWWYKYYNGDQGLGGSMVFNLADISKTFGINGSDIYKEIYTTFGGIQSKLYPKDLPAIVEYSKAVDKSFIADVVSNHPELLTGKALEVKYTDAIRTTVASKDVQINFETGSAIISLSSYSILQEVLSSAITAEGLKVGIYGHTDNTGNPEANQKLSEARAASVAKWLKAKGIPEDRIESMGYGDEKPIADNNTAAGKAQNRRVQIVLGN